MSRITSMVRQAFTAFGFQLEYIENDFDSRPLDDFTYSRIMAKMAEAFEEWSRVQTIFVIEEKFDVERATRRFFEQWLNTPFRKQVGGSRFNNLLWLHLITISYKPTLIVDSGTFEGASAWALAKGAPEATVLSFDISLKRVKHREATAAYMERDWSSFDLAEFDRTRFLCYFDDHVDQVRRLIEAADRGCHVAVFDDDYPVTSFYAMAPSPSVLPKIEFVLDSKALGGRTLEWTTRRGKKSFTIDGAYLAQGRERIESTVRLPNTSLITGIHQTPYRVVKVATRNGSST